MFFPALWVNCLSQMGILEPDSQTKPSLMYPCDMCFSPGALITHLEAIWDVNHHRCRRQGSASTAATGSSHEQPPIVSSLLLPLPGYGTLAGSSLTWFYSITPGTRGGVERPARERWRRRRRTASQRKAALSGNGRPGTERGRSNRCIKNKSCGGALAA